MTFGKAIQILKDGGIVTRRGWVPAGMWLVYIEGRTRWREDQPPTPYERGLQLQNCTDSHVEINGHIDQCTADGSMQMGWTPNQIDMLAGDWQIVEQVNVQEKGINP